MFNKLLHWAVTWGDIQLTRQVSMIEPSLLTASPFDWRESERERERATVRSSHWNASIGESPEHWRKKKKKRAERAERAERAIWKLCSDREWSWNRHSYPWQVMKVKSGRNIADEWLLQRVFCCVCKRVCVQSLHPSMCRLLLTLLRVSRQCTLSVRCLALPL